MAPSQEKASTKTDSSSSRVKSASHLGILINLLLLFLVIGVFYPSLQNGFVAFDDNVYVYENSQVRSGLTWGGVQWAFSTLDVGGLWHPLTWLSLMLDCELFGLQPGGHHLTGLLLHAINTVLLFVALRRLTSATWRSAVVAALFAVHPLHVETVAWISDRKDALGALFFMLSLIMYSRYVQVSGNVARTSEATGFQPRTTAWRPMTSGCYWLVIFFFTCGLLSKPTVMILPAILLLLDCWPLQRLESAGQGMRFEAIRLLIVEKLPLLAVGLFCALIGIYGQKKFGMLQTTAQFPLVDRIPNSVISCFQYLVQMFWPAGLAAYYPYPRSFPILPQAGMAVAELAMSLVVLKAFWRRPYLAIGWFWYLVALFPVIGLVQIGSYARADRYTYLPLIGVFLLLAWGAYDLTKRWRFQTFILSVVAGIAILSCAVLARQQLAVWQNSETLFRHAVESVPENYVAHNNLGNALVRGGRLVEAKGHFLAALKIHPAFGAAHYNLANILTGEGDLAGALTHYNTAVESQPDYADARYNLGIILTKLGKPGDAVVQFREAARLKPNFVEAHHSLGGALVQLGRTAEGIVELIEAVRLKPDFAHARNDLGIALALSRNPSGAETNFAALTRLEPLNADAHYNLANSLSEQGKFKAAASEYAEVLRLNPQDQNARNKLQKLQPETSP
ncbi:MAG: tetratricopeptide repeat protein [Verrucomicrobia bacterium]|nr:tetratricopeptide repeat protein [Verrucomicrobiota bacterium]